MKIFDLLVQCATPPPSYSSFYYCNRSDAEFALLTNCRFLLFQRVATTTDCFYCIHPSPRALNWALKRILTAFFILLFAMPNYNNTSFISHYGEVKFWSYRTVVIFSIPGAGVAIVYDCLFFFLLSFLNHQIPGG